MAGLDGIGRESERVELKGVMSQGRVIDIMTFNSYSLQNYSFWKGTRIIGFKTELRRIFLVAALEIFGGNLY